MKTDPFSPGKNGPLRRKISETHFATAKHPTVGKRKNYDNFVDAQGHKEQNNQPTPVCEMQSYWEPLLMQPGGFAAIGRAGCPCCQVRATTTMSHR